MTIAETLPLTFASPAGRHVGMTAVALIACGVPAADVAAGFKLALYARIDERAEALRQRLLSPGAGQAMEYQEVHKQALAALAEPDAATAPAYPMLAATVGIDFDPETKAPATDVLGVARAAVAAYDAWVVAGSAIRAARLGAKAAVEAASTVEEAEAAYEAARWPALPD